MYLEICIIRSVAVVIVVVIKVLVRLVKTVPITCRAATKWCVGQHILLESGDYRRVILKTRIATFTQKGHTGKRKDEGKGKGKGIGIRVRVMV